MYVRGLRPGNMLVMLVMLVIYLRALDKMVYNAYVKQRILFYYQQGYKAPTIAKLLREDDVRCTRVGVVYFLNNFRRTGTIVRHPGSSRPSKITVEVKEIGEQQMRLDDETTATRLHRILTVASSSRSVSG